MRKILMCAHSFYMLLTVIQIRMTALKDEKVDLVFSDVSKGSEKVVERLRSEKLFDHVYFLREGALRPRGSGVWVERFSGCMAVISPEKHQNKAGMKGTDYNYDVFFCHVAEKYIEQVLFIAIKKKNPKAVCELYEEGYGSYLHEEGVLATNHSMSHKFVPIMVRLLRGEGSLSANNVNAMWFFRPEFIQFKCNHKIKSITPLTYNQSELRSILNRIFSFDGNMDVLKDYQFILLENSAYADGLPTDDLELIEEIKDHILNRGGIIVKQHPRSKGNRFEALSVSNCSLDAPLELLGINGLLDGKVLITVDSGSPLSCLVHFNSKIKILMLLNITKFPLPTVKLREFEQYLADVEKYYGSDRLAIPNTKGELMKIVDDMLEQS